MYYLDALVDVYYKIIFLSNISFDLLQIALLSNTINFHSFVAYHSHRIFNLRILPLHLNYILLLRESQIIYWIFSAHGFLTDE